MNSRNGSSPTPETWLGLLRSAYSLFDDLEARGFGKAPFLLGGGTVLMLDLAHRLSRDIDLFAYDVQWLTLLTPRLNEKAGSFSTERRR